MMYQYACFWQYKSIRFTHTYQQSALLRWHRKSQSHQCVSRGLHLQPWPARSTTSGSLEYLRYTISAPQPSQLDGYLGEVLQHLGVGRLGEEAELVGAWVEGCCCSLGHRHWEDRLMGWTDGGDGGGDATRTGEIGGTDGGGVVEDGAVEDVRRSLVDETAASPGQTLLVVWPFLL